MSIPYLTLEDVKAILQDESIISIDTPLRGGQKAVIPINTSQGKYLAKFIEIPQNELCSFDEFESVEDATLGRLKREIEILSKSNCENVVKVYSDKLNYVQYNNHHIYYYIEEYIEGNDLYALINQGYQFSINDIFNLAFCINNAISCLWKNKIIHRDIKPQNILYNDINKKFILIDPGIAFDLADISYTQPGQTVGTPIYMAPEQFKPALKRNLDFRTDHFLLGMSLYCVATNSHPFHFNATSIQEVQFNILNRKHIPINQQKPDFPLEFSNIIDRLLSKEVFKRYRTIDALDEDLRKAQGVYYDSLHTT